MQNQEAVLNQAIDRLQQAQEAQRAEIVAANERTVAAVGALRDEIAALKQEYPQLSDEIARIDERAQAALDSTATIRQIATTETPAETPTETPVETPVSETPTAGEPTP